jgi:glycerol-3-phosphate responsive antiterminator
MSASTIVYSRSALLALGTETVSADLSKALDLVTSNVLTAAKANKHTVTVKLTLLDPTTIGKLVERVTERFPDVNVIQGAVPTAVQMPTRVPAAILPNACLVLTWE